jgi:hypothetical protein
MKSGLVAIAIKGPMIPVPMTSNPEINKNVKTIATRDL